MAEAFGVGAGILTVVDLTTKIISRCKHLIETAQDAPKELRYIFVETSSLKSVLESLEFLLENQSGFPDVVRNLGSVDRVVQECNTTVEDLARELGGISLSQGSQTSVGKRQMFKESLSWCLKESKVRKLLGELAQHKATITLTLLSDITQDVKDIKRTGVTIKSCLLDDHLRKISNWMEEINPTLTHKFMQGLHENNTCHWFSRIDHWKMWLSCRQRLVWTHGIPGAGKTVLASYLIEQVENHCQGLKFTNRTCLYYYCSYLRGQDEAKPLLKWIVSQLCRRSREVPLPVATAYSKNHELSLEELKNALKYFLSTLDVLYIIIDAADESKPRKHFLQLLRELASSPDFAKIQMLVTSRGYIDIDNVLRPIARTIPMSNPVVDADIRIYVDTALQNDRRFSRWAKNLSEEVLESLVRGAKGMFRWAACQLDVLRRKRSLQDIRKAIQQLPQALDETYERILLEIPQDDWAYARSALLWICAHEDLGFNQGIPSNCLLSAMFQNEEDHNSQDPSILLVNESLQDILGCLIHVSEEASGDTVSSISLAHYTVREYLFSTRTALSTASFFSMSRNTCAREVLQIAFRPPAKVDEDFLSVPFNRNFERYCYDVALLGLRAWDPFIAQDDTLFGLLQNISSHPLFFNRCWKEISSEHLTDGYASYMSLYPLKKPLSEASRHAQFAYVLSVLGCRKTLARFLKGVDVYPLLSASLHTKLSWQAENQMVIDGPEYITILDALGTRALGHRTESINDLLHKRIRPTDALLFLLAAHYHEWTCNDEKPCIMIKTLRNGADVNAKGLAIMPLQIAVHRWDFAGTLLLLMAGADPNGIGDPNGAMLSHIDTKWASSSPLHILRNAEYGLTRTRDCGKLYDSRVKMRAGIEQLLIECGARDFSSTFHSLSTSQPKVK